MEQTTNVIRAAVEAGIPAMAAQHAEWMRAQIARFSALSRRERTGTPGQSWRPGWIALRELAGTSARP